MWRRIFLPMACLVVAPPCLQARQTYYSHLGEQGSKIYYEQHLAAERRLDQANQQQALEDARNRRGLYGPAPASDPTAPLSLLAGTLSSLSKRLQASAPKPQLTIAQKLALIRAKADKGDLEAKVDLAWVYANGYRDKNGFEFPKDDTLARYWSLRAAEGGDPSNQIEVGMRLLFGIGEPASPQEGAAWIQKASDRGHADARFLLSLLLDSGKGVAKDPTQAKSLLKSAAERGSAGAQEALAEHYYFGEGWAKDDAQAVHWFTLAASQGLALAQYNLGAMHLKERAGVEGWDAFKAALTWFQKAARQGQMDAQYSLGFMYASGIGTDSNLPEAEFWYTQAADQGDSQSQKALAELRRLAH